jgi:hypothetical protein
MELIPTLNNVNINNDWGWFVDIENIHIQYPNNFEKMKNKYSIIHTLNTIDEIDENDENNENNEISTYINITDDLPYENESIIGIYAIRYKIKKNNIFIIMKSFLNLFLFAITVSFIIIFS